MNETSILRIYHSDQSDLFKILLIQSWVNSLLGSFIWFNLLIFAQQIETQWRFVIVAFLVADFGCWIFFAVLWYLISYSHNDFNYNSVTGMPLHEGSMTCLRGVTSLTDYFLYSFEIQVIFFMIWLIFASFYKNNLKQNTFLFKNLSTSIQTIDNCWLWRKISKRRMPRSCLSFCYANRLRDRYRRCTDRNHLRKIVETPTEALWFEIQSQSRDLSKRCQALPDVSALWSKWKPHHWLNGASVFIRWSYVRIKLYKDINRAQLNAWVFEIRLQLNKIVFLAQMKEIYWINFSIRWNFKMKAKFM